MTISSMTARLRSAGWRVVSLALTLGLTAVAYTGVSVLRSSFHVAGPAKPLPPAVNPIKSGKHLVAFLVISEECGWSTQPATIKSIVHLKEALVAAHRQQYREISLVAIDVDADVATGWRFLNSLQHGIDKPLFDQVDIGGTWLNNGFLNLDWRQHLAVGSTPQIVVVERNVDGGEYMTSGKISVGADSLLTRVIGMKNIAQWLQKGTPLASSPSSSAP